MDVPAVLALFRRNYERIQPNGNAEVAFESVFLRDLRDHCVRKKAVSGTRRRLLREGGLSLLSGEVGTDSLFNAIWVLGPQSGGEAKWNTQRALFAFGVPNAP